jgi:hypothetical protein
MKINNNVDITSIIKIVVNIELDINNNKSQ